MIVDSTVAGMGGLFVAALYNDAGVVHIIRTIFERDVIDIGTVYSRGGEVRISESSFKRNGAAHGSGGFRATAGATARIVHTTFIGNSGDGVGAIAVESEATVIVRHSALIDNGSTATGGILVHSGGTAHVTNTTFASNRAGFFCEASAILNAGTITVVNSTFVDNKPIASCGSRGPVPVIRGGHLHLGAKHYRL
jgi:hypothetical protein